ncbi:Lycopene cyclase [Candidatus Portiera aleyrodidarum]|uniref:lycopene cyclase family protein n=1 Tax=Candidatus Portiera aleyrodidarum TaxID=91844 RepID=UPI0005D9ACDA|nr:lycopene cyclase family protein [Candidatus Portiera aleyrodidarum]CEL12476.1 Lycopene cyclase [Candidatus Portiera aleyrodidarum]
MLKKKIYDIDILILGGGCAGLSLAYYLSFLPNNLNILIIENKKFYYNDKTWCGWRIKNHAFINCCKKTWYNIKIKKEKNSYSIINFSIPYEYILSILFYKKIINRIKILQNIKIYNNKILNIKEYNDYVSIKLNNGEYKIAHWVIDTLPKKIKINLPWKWQNFFGIELYSNKKYSKPSLMNFYINKYLKSNKLNFIYILPINKNQILFEWTNFYKKKNLYIKKLLIYYINIVLGIYNYKILRKETGHIPMAYIINKKKLKNLAKIYGCYIRPSTGYSFNSIQNWAIKCAYNLSINKKIIIPKVPYFLIFLDYIYMKTNEFFPKNSLLLYNNIFYKIKSNTFIKFFTNNPNIIDIFNILFFLKPKSILLYTFIMMLFK